MFSSETDGSQNGVLFIDLLGNTLSVAPRDIHDGLSNTVMVAEGAKVEQINYGFWSHGKNCFSHDDGPVNNPVSFESEIFSFHSGGANALACDGSITFIANNTDRKIVGAMCTRSEQDPY